MPKVPLHLHHVPGVVGATAVLKAFEQQDLVQRLLSHLETQRPSAAASLEHPWLSDDGGAAKGRQLPSAVQSRQKRIENEDLIDDGIIIAEDPGAK